MKKMLYLIAVCLIQKWNLVLEREASVALYYLSKPRVLNDYDLVILRHVQFSHETFSKLSNCNG